MHSLQTFLTLHMYNFDIFSLCLNYFYFAQDIYLIDKPKPIQNGPMPF